MPRRRHRAHRDRHDVRALVERFRSVFLDNPCRLFHSRAESPEAGLAVWTRWGEGMEEKAAPRRHYAARRLVTSRDATLRGEAQMPRPRCSGAAVAEARVRGRRWSVVGGSGARAPRSREQGGCHWRPPAQPEKSRAYGHSRLIQKLAVGLGIHGTPCRFGAPPKHRERPSGCEVDGVPQNGNPGSEQCAAARLVQGEG